ncbi:HNH endonuclease signature motif containing protein [Heyndrickxia coagulans]|uniref:HNH endonuclease signature motif containing protein n=1 Tax=Heyndrickxia coagulans TaxID=1398 RepID=UPI0018A7362C|nr:HNH endonuclease signature motif containing protein [Heyndrickxia coagulans]MBF8418931.1 HNH endonuclease [Heyndrickxia coagulans]
MLFYDGHKIYMNGDYPAIFLDGENYHVHRLEWQKYNGEIPEGYVIHHKDENKLNWSIENLELLTRGEHIKRHKDVVKRPGVKVIARKGKHKVIFNSIKEAAKFCETHTSCIQKIFKNKQRTANGWFFERG